MNLAELNAKEFEEKFVLMIDGILQKEDIKEFLLDLNQSNLPVNAFIGAVSALRKKMVAIDLEEDVIDVCGTGGDCLNTLNISTAVSFVLAGLGLKVAKHGNKAISSRSGSADIFNELGIKHYVDPKQINDQISRNNLCFFFAPLFHSSLKSLGQIRQELAVPTIFNFLGPLLNPAGATTQLIGTSRKDTVEKIARVKINQFNGKNLKTAIIHGFDGMDEITLSDKSYLTTVIDDQIISKEIIDPAKYGLAKIDIEEIKGGDPSYNAKRLVDLLDGRKSAYQDIVVLNAAFALRLAGKVASAQEGIELARSSIEQGKAKEILIKIKDDL